MFSFGTAAAGKAFGRVAGSSASSRCVRTQQVTRCADDGLVPFLAGAAVIAAMAAGRERAKDGHGLCFGNSPSGVKFAQCEAPHRRGPAEHKAVPSPPSSDARATVTDGRDFAVFRRQPGTRAVQDGVADVACFSDMLDAITAGIAPAPRETNLSKQNNAPGTVLGEMPAAVQTDVILLGEVHDDKVAHHLQLEVLSRCIEVCKESGRRVVLSLEMFESDVQEVLDEYVLRRAIREEDFLQDARPWATYMDDYRPLVELCRDEGVRVVAANAPRRYVSLAARGGSASLQHLLRLAPQGAQLSSLLPPLPLPPASASYHRKFIETIASQMPAPEDSEASAGGCPYIGFDAESVRQATPQMMDAQLLWDHAMAQSIARSLQSKPPRGVMGTEDGPLIVHVCGAFHCAHGLGIPEVLPQYYPQAAAPAKPLPWLPIDDAFPAETALPEGDGSLGPKLSPPGVLSVICWPGCVGATLKMVQGGQQLRSLATMGDWVIVTEETWNEA